MKRRIAIWACVGFVIASCWIIYTFVAPRAHLSMTMREPVIEALAYASVPIAFGGRYFPLSFWWFPPINAATYAVFGLIVEMLRRRSNPSLAV